MISLADENYIKERLKDIAEQGNTYYIKIVNGVITVDDKPLGGIDNEEK